MMIDGRRLLKGSWDGGGRRWVGAGGRSWRAEDGRAGGAMEKMEDKMVERESLKMESLLIKQKLLK